MATRKYGLLNYLFISVVIFSLQFPINLVQAQGTCNSKMYDQLKELTSALYGKCSDPQFGTKIMNVTPINYSDTCIKCSGIFSQLDPKISQIFQSASQIKPEQVKCPDGCKPAAQASSVVRWFPAEVQTEGDGIATCNKLFDETKKNPSVVHSPILPDRKKAQDWLSSALGDKKSAHWQKCPDPCSFYNTIAFENVAGGIQVGLVVVCGPPRVKHGIESIWNVSIEGRWFCEKK